MKVETKLTKMSGEKSSSLVAAVPPSVVISRDRCQCSQSRQHHAADRKDASRVRKSPPKPHHADRKQQWGDLEQDRGLPQFRAGGECPRLLPGSRLVAGHSGSRRIFRIKGVTHMYLHHLTDMREAVRTIQWFLVRRKLHRRDIGADRR